MAEAQTAQEWIEVALAALRTAMLIDCPNYVRLFDRCAAAAAVGDDGAFWEASAEADAELRRMAGKMPQSLLMFSRLVGGGTSQTATDTTEQGG